MSLAPFFAFDGYKLGSISGSPLLGKFEVTLERCENKPKVCCECGTRLGVKRGQHIVTVKDVPVFSCPVVIRFWRLKGHCETCGKARSEAVSFLAEVTPHLTRHYAAWLAHLAEIAPICQAAAFTGEAKQTLWRLDFERLKHKLALYKVPPVRRIGVDEVCARKKLGEGETRDDRFFTVVVDLDRRQVLWITDSRRQEALEEFFEKIGHEACKRIEVAALDQHEGYARAVYKWCPNARVVWDKFHLVRNFMEVVEETRKWLCAKIPRSKARKMVEGRNKYIFLKKDAARSKKEKQHIAEALANNEELLMLELIKERVLSFFEAGDEDEGRAILSEVASWISEAEFTPLWRWYLNLREGWQTLRMYFTYRYTSAMSEGLNNLIKSIKRRSFGFRNMEYFKLKIMQVCGYLNSQHYPDENGLYVRGLACLK